MKAKFEELETNSNINILGTYIRASVTLKGFQPRNIIVKDEKGDLFADSNRIYEGGGNISPRY